MKHVKVTTLSLYKPSNTSPLEREILTHYYCYPRPWKNGSENWAPADHAAVERFLKLGLLKHVANTDEQADYGNGYHIEANHEALQVYMQALGDVLLPIQQWAIPAPFPENLI